MLLCVILILQSAIFFEKVGSSLKTAYKFRRTLRYGIFYRIITYVEYFTEKLLIELIKTTDYLALHSDSDYTIPDIFNLAVTDSPPFEGLFNGVRFI